MVGRSVRAFNQVIREEHRTQITLSGNVARFSVNTVVEEFLVGTGNRVLVEASAVDKVWGISLEKGNSYPSTPFEWRDDDLLGFVLMEAPEVQSV